MTEAQLILSVATIICSGVVSAIVTYKLNARKDERQLLRQKLEELNLAMLRFCTQLDTNFLPYISVMTGNITYNQALDIVLNSKDTEKNYDKISMIVNIYFPQLSSNLENIHTARGAGNEVIHDFKRFYESAGTHSQQHYQKMSAVVNLLGKAESDFKAAIREEARKIKKIGF
ncbi:MAG: hypothetical protein HZB54_07530 [Deltaproteobacteria bacterium]|nr:hypothetical protein [Deltaproteobacteria bacterium]